MEKLLSIEIPRDQVIYDGKIKKGYKGQGVIRIKDKSFKSYSYAIFPIKCKKIGGKIMILIDEVLSMKAELNEDNYQLNFNRKYAGKSCVIITSDDPISLNLTKRGIIYDGIMKETYNGQGIVRIKDRYLGARSHIIFPISLKDEGDMISIAVDDILNEGIQPDTTHTCRVLLSKRYVGRKCIIVLQDDIRDYMTAGN